MADQPDLFGSPLEIVARAYDEWERNNLRRGLPIEPVMDALGNWLLKLRAAREAGAVPVLLSRQTVDSMQAFVDTNPDDSLAVSVTGNNTLYYLQGDVDHLLKVKP